MERVEGGGTPLDALAPAPTDEERAGRREDPYLVGLGRRVREMRAVRGMSRKVLSRASGISERYIAQLESGQGNASVLLLRRISAAIGMRLEDLIAEPGGSGADWLVLRDLLRGASPEQVGQVRAILGMRSPSAAGVLPGEPAERIALIGLRGAGKSTLGRMAAARLGWPFVELNREIERTTGLSVPEIFALYGQEGYRRFEGTCLKALVAQPGPMVLATGGGVVAEPLTFDLLLFSFFTVWLQARPEEHMARVRAQGDLRPMADDRGAMQELRGILQSRTPLYGRADAALDTSGLTVEDAAARLVELVRQAGAVEVGGAPGGMKEATLGDLLRERDLWEPGTRAVRTTLHAADRSSDLPSHDELVRQNLVPVYERMQDGRRFGDGGRVVSFVAEPAGRARLLGLRRASARRRGLVPGDIVYDYDAAPLLHAFIARARAPFFYDMQDEPGLDDLVGRLVVRWPAPLMAHVRAADDGGLLVEGVEGRQRPEQA